jgi:hypothetical protein
MAILAPEQQAARIIAHYLKHLTIATGKRWTAQNDRDMSLLGELLGVVEEAADEIPPYEAPVVSERVTQSFEAPDYGDPQFRTWRAGR